MFTRFKARAGSCSSNMDIYVHKIDNTLVCASDADAERIAHLNRNTVYRCRIAPARNYRHHKKYFSLITLAWEYLNDDQQKFFLHSAECFRKTVEVAAGWYEPVYSMERKSWLQVPKSIAFDKMNQDQFNELYENVKRVLFEMFIKNNQDEFLNQLNEY